MGRVGFWSEGKREFALEENGFPGAWPFAGRVIHALMQFEPGTAPQGQHLPGYGARPSNERPTQHATAPGWEFLASQQYALCRQPPGDTRLAHRRGSRAEGVGPQPRTLNDSADSQTPRVPQAPERGAARTVVSEPRVSRWSQSRRKTVVFGRPHCVIAAPSSPR